MKRQLRVSFPLGFLKFTMKYCWTYTKLERILPYPITRLKESSLVYIYIYFLRRSLLCNLAWNSLCTSHGPCVHSDPSALTSLVLGLLPWATTSHWETSLFYQHSHLSPPTSSYTGVFKAKTWKTHFLMANPRWESKGFWVSSSVDRLAQGRQVLGKGPLKEGGFLGGPGGVGVHPSQVT